MKRIWSDCRKCHKFAIQSKTCHNRGKHDEKRNKVNNRKTFAAAQGSRWMERTMGAGGGAGVGSVWVEASVGVAWHPNLAFEQ